MAQKQTTEMSKHETDILLGLYSGCECLWNKKSSDYKENPVKMGAYRTIMHGMRLETGKDFSLGQVQSSLHKIQSKYTQELKRVMDAEKDPSNDYTSEWRWFQFLDSFLRDQVLQSQSDGADLTADFHIQPQEAEREQGGDTSETDDYECMAASDSDGEGRSGQGFGASSSSQTTPTPTPTPAPSTKSNALLMRETRPVRSSRLKARSSMMNGAGFSSQDLSPSPSPSSHTRSSSKKLKTSTQSYSPLRQSRRRGGAGEGDVMVQMADTLTAVQTLLATTLTNQDQPSMVFARHIANELQQIENYAQRKQCMLDIQQVILGYQKARGGRGGGPGGAIVKPEVTGGTGGRHEGVRGIGGNMVGVQSSSSALASTGMSQCMDLEDPLLIHFESNIA